MRVSECVCLKAVTALCLLEVTDDGMLGDSLVYQKYFQNNASACILYVLELGCVVEHCFWQE